jgi:hypothetical protein
MEEYRQKGRADDMAKDIMKHPSQAPVDRRLRCLYYLKDWNGCNHTPRNGVADFDQHAHAAALQRMEKIYGAKIV